MAINIMGELQERMKKIEYVTVNSKAVINPFENKEKEKYDSDKLDKISKNVEILLEKINSEEESINKLKGTNSDKSLLETVAEIITLIYNTKQSMTGPGGKPSKSQAAKIIDTVFESVLEICENAGIEIEACQENEENLIESISYNGETVECSE